MSGETEDEITSLLNSAKSGQPGARQRLFTLVYYELKKLAKNRIKYGDNWAIQTTGLVHETYMRMVKDDQASWANRHHFFWAAARAMRDILVEQARYDAASKRGGGRKRVELDDEALAEPDRVCLIDLNEALEKLAVEHPMAAQVVKLKYFAGLTREQIAEILDVSSSTVWREWSFARAWLADQLSGGSEREK